MMTEAREQNTVKFYDQNGIVKQSLFEVSDVNGNHFEKPTEAEAQATYASQREAFMAKQMEIQEKIFNLAQKRVNIKNFDMKLMDLNLP